MQSAEAGARVRRLRLASGISQVEFATALNTSNGTISMIETGRQLMTPELRQVMARVLGCSTQYLEAGEPDQLVSQPFLRAYADAPKRAVDMYLADASTAMQAVTQLQLQVIADAMPTFLGDADDDSDVEAFAQDVRAAAQIEDGAVVGNVIRAAERLGCLVLPMPTELGRHLGMSCRIDNTPVIAVSRAVAPGGSGVPGDRQRFTVAHEIAHLGLHGHLTPPQQSQDAVRLEKQAHLFAGAFLAPGDAMLDELRRAGGRVTLQTLSAIKARWGISVKALVMRFRNLGLIDADHARSLYKQISARGWNKNEPVPVGGEDAIWLSRAINKRFVGTGSLDQAAKSVGLDRSHLARWTDWSESSRTEAKVLTMPDRKSSQGSPRQFRDGAVRPIQKDNDYRQEL